MNKFYHVDNKGHKHAKSHWLIAKDNDDAIRIASTEYGTPTNLQELKPSDNINEIIKSGKTGLLAMQLQGIIASELNNNTKPKPIQKPWFIYKEV